MDEHAIADERHDIEAGKVSVVIAAYNAAEHIERCLASIFAQSYNDLQVIIVDDASSDATAEVVRNFGKSIEYIRLDRNRGPAYARTVGLFRSRGEFVAIVDADDFWVPEFVATTAAFMKSHPRAVAVSTAYRSQRWDGRELHLPVLDGRDATKFTRNGALIEDFFGFWNRYMHILTGTALMRTSVVRQTGGQREELRLTEDLEFWGYLATFGAWGFIPQHLFVTDERAVSTSQRLSKIAKRYRLFSDMSTEEWERRIRPRVTAEDEDSFNAVVARMGTAIAIANAYSGFYRNAWVLTGRYRESMNEGLGKVLRAGLRFGKYCWPFFCMAIRGREYAKAYLPRFPALPRLVGAPEPMRNNEAETTW